MGDPLVSRRRLSAVCGVTVAGFLLFVDPAQGSEEGNFHGRAEDAVITVVAAPPGTGSGGSANLAAVSFREKRIPRRTCGKNVAISARTCVSDALSSPVMCADGSKPQNPLYRRGLDENGNEFGPWVQIDNGCPADPQAAVFVSVEDFRRLPLTPSVPSFQPANGRGLVNMELIVFTDPASQVLQTTVLGTPVTVQATPTSFSWDFGDGSEALVTTDPGAPYPEFRVFHVYEQPGSFQVQLTTTWSGQFQVNGQGPWFAVTGTAQTVSPAFAETVVEARSHLVDGPLP